MTPLLILTVGSAFQPWSPTQRFRQLEQHDDLFACRAALREVIHAARLQQRPGERLPVNPASDTKQMSVAAGALLAASPIRAALSVTNPKSEI